MQNQPLVSFCIATYKRPHFLKETIKSILSQTYSNIEIIVSDNDPFQSAKNVLESFHSKKIFYIPQKKNVGMVKNFMTSANHSKGEFMVFCADDDPIQSQMAEKLVNLSYKYPRAISYFGAPFLLVRYKEITKVHKTAGKVSMRNKKIKKGEIREFSPEFFMPSFLGYEIFDYFLWSAGMVRKSVAKKAISRLPTESNYLSDFTYILSVGCMGRIVTINEELAYQTIHRENFGRTKGDLLTLKIAAHLFYKNFKGYAVEFNCQSSLEKFLRNWITSHLISVLRFQEANNKPEEKLFLINLYKDIKNVLPFLSVGQMSFYLRIIFPQFSNVYDDYKWIFEKKTLEKAILKVRTAFR